MDAAASKATHLMRGIRNYLLFLRTLTGMEPSWFLLLVFYVIYNNHFVQFGPLFSVSHTVIVLHGKREKRLLAHDGLTIFRSVNFWISFHSLMCDSQLDSLGLCNHSYRFLLSRYYHCVRWVMEALVCKQWYLQMCKFDYVNLRWWPQLFYFNFCRQFECHSFKCSFY